MKIHLSLKNIRDCLLYTTNRAQCCMAVILEILIARNSKKCILCYDTVYLQMYLRDLKFYEAIFNFNMCNTS